MIKTTTITELRAELATLINGLDEGPVMVLARSHPAAVLIEPEMYDALLEKCELLEDLLDGRRLIAEYMEDQNSGVDAEEVFRRLGH